MRDVRDEQRVPVGRRPAGRSPAAGSTAAGLFGVWSTIRLLATARPRRRSRCRSDWRRGLSCERARRARRGNTLSAAPQLRLARLQVVAEPSTVRSPQGSSRPCPVAGIWFGPRAEQGRAGVGGVVAVAAWFGDLDLLEDEPQVGGVQVEALPTARAGVATVAGRTPATISTAAQPATVRVLDRCCAAALTLRRLGRGAEGMGTPRRRTAEGLGIAGAVRTRSGRASAGPHRRGPELRERAAGASSAFSSCDRAVRGPVVADRRGSGPWPRSRERR